MTKSEKPTVSSASKEKEMFLKQLLTNEKTRYERKGYGLVFATLIALSFVFGIPALAQTYWPLFVENENELKWGFFWWHTIFAILLHNIIHGVANIIFYVFYHFEFDFIERYKSNDLQWPWYEDPEGWRTLCMKSVGVLLFNGNILIPFFLFLAEVLGLTDEHTMGMEDLPDVKTFALSLIFFMFVEDSIFYWAHRFLHMKWIYPHIHKMHHTHSSTVSIASEYAHPLEFMLSNILPTTVGPMILGYRCHFVTVVAWYIFRYAENLDGHCGYDFSWSPFRLIPFSSGGAYHDYHHAVNIGNYASLFSVWDTVYGTNKTYYEVQNKVDDASAKKVKSQ